MKWRRGSRYHRAKIRGSALVVVLGLLVVGLMVPAVTLAQATPIASPVASGSVEITGLVEHPGAVTVALLQTMPTQTVDVTYQAGNGEEHHTYTGVRLATVIDKLGLVQDTTHKNGDLQKYLVVSASDGYQVVISWGEIDPKFGNQPILLAWQEDGKPLTGDRGPVRLVVPGDVHGGRYVTGVTKIEVRDLGSPPVS